MPRSTLKLPPKTTTVRETEDPRLAPRKPIRGGFKSAKQSVAQRDEAVAAKAARFASAAEKAGQGRERPRSEPRFSQDAPRPSARPSPPVSAERGERKSAPRAAEAPRVYPPRGVARSSGARALPPARPPSETTDSVPRAEVEIVARQPLTPSPQPVRAPRRGTPPAAHATEAKDVRRPQNEPPRLSKRISEMSQCSRREADEWIENGWVRVDGVVVTTLGTRVHPNAKVEIKEEASKHLTESVTILLNKPLGDASGGDDESAVNVLQMIRPENRWSEDDSRLTFKATHLRGLAQAGRLDADATGMLVFTQEGSVARRITGDDTRLEKEFMVRVEGELSPAGLKLLNHGLELDEVKLKRAQVSWQNEEQLRFVLHESKRQQIQRMCELVGLRVVSIKRIRIGSVSLGKLPAGQWRYLRESERF
ncbi:MAG: S4 domain-containing protein [Betaproteobacteria bacterium]